MRVHPDSIVFTSSGIKRAAALTPGTQLVGLDAEPSVPVESVAVVDGLHDVVTLRSKHRHLTTPPTTKLLMLRRSPVEVYPPRDGWWTEEHPIADLMEACVRGADCSITSCWCLQHKRHFVVLNHLREAQRLRHEPKCRVGPEGKPHPTRFTTDKEATRARFAHIAHGHVVSPVHSSTLGHQIHIASTNTRARMIHDWGIAPSLPGPQFSVERVTDIAVSSGPLVELVVAQPVVIEAMVVCP